MIFEDHYGRLDRLLHRVAFRTGFAQEALADVETLLYRETLSAIPLESPVFISGLPRAGTTILLNLLWATGTFASHTYRDVPFVLCPMLWNRFSRSFAVTLSPRERAHGDGLTVSGTSPEAFEEMVWKYFWPEHYLSDRIRPWSTPAQHEEFDEFFELHMRKVIVLRQRERPSVERYVSKNNVNIARLSTLPGPLATGVLLVPFREPIQHAASLLRQHRRFLEIQQQEDFVRRYMSGVGHHDFGRDFRPIDFGGWYSSASDPEKLGFWLQYWIAAYRHVLEHARPGVTLVSYDRLVADPTPTLHAVAETVGVPGPQLVSRAEELHPPRDHPVSDDELPDALVGEARALFEVLMDRALV